MLEEFCFVWISLIEKMDNFIFIKLVKPVVCIEKLYQLTSNKIEFSKYLINNNILISEEMFNQLTNFNLKSKAKEFYKYLISKEISIIHLYSNEYSLIFKSFGNFIPTFFVYGNYENIKNQKMYIYSEKDSKSTIFIENKFKKSKNIKKYSLVEDIKNKVDNTNSDSNIYVGDINQIMKKDIKLSTKDFYIFSNIKSQFIIPYICDIILIINAKYKYDIVSIVDIMLELGKEIYVVPNNILDKNAYFSNFLICEGAKIIINDKNI